MPQVAFQEKAIVKEWRRESHEISKGDKRIEIQKVKGESPPLRVSQQTAEMSPKWIPEYDLGMDVLWRIERGLDCNCSRTSFKDELNQAYQRRDRRDNTM